MKQFIFSGLIQEKYYMNNEEALFVGDSEYPIVEEFEENFDERQVSIRYYISDTRKTKQELLEGLILNICGAVEAEYYDKYSECTGYLWTEENMVVGGHNLEQEIRSYVGKYLYLEVDLHEQI